MHLVAGGILGKWYNFAFLVNSKCLTDDVPMYKNLKGCKSFDFSQTSACVATIVDVSELVG